MPNYIKRSCGLLIINKEKQILLQLRDNIDIIPYPNCWSTFGGQIEENETPEDAIIRELKEELNYDLKNPQLFKIYSGLSWEMHVYIKEDFEMDLTKYSILEGQKGEFFSINEIHEINFAFNIKDVCLDLFEHLNKNSKINDDKN